MLREIRSLGFEYAELSHGIRISLVPGIIEAVEAGEIKISTLHNFCPLPIGINYPAPNIFKFTATDRREREYAWKHSLKTLETAQRLGAKLVVLHSGQVDIKDYQDKLEEMVINGQKDTPKYRKLVEEVESKREKKKDEALRLSLEIIGGLAQHAAERGLLLGVENRESVAEIPFDHDLAFFIASLPDNVRYWHDCGHAQIKQDLGFLNHREHLESLAPRLAGFHIHDVVSNAEGIHDHCPPGSGEIDYAALQPLVKPEHIKVIELSPGVPPEDVQRGFAHIKSVWGEE